MRNPRWLGTEGWVKMQSIVYDSKGKTVLHFVYNTFTGAFDDFKFNIEGESEAGQKKKYYEWDHTHNDIEVYNKNGRHLSSMDPTTGEMYKLAV